MIENNVWYVDTLSKNHQTGEITYGVYSITRTKAENLKKLDRMIKNTDLALMIQTLLRTESSVQENQTWYKRSYTEEIGPLHIAHNLILFGKVGASEPDGYFTTKGRKYGLGSIIEMGQEMVRLNPRKKPKVSAGSSIRKPAR